MAGTPWNKSGRLSVCDGYRKRRAVPTRAGLRGHPDLDPGGVRRSFGGESTTPSPRQTEMTNIPRLTPFPSWEWGFFV